MRNVLFGAAMLALAPAVGCGGGGTNINDFDYGSGQPGTDLPEGGEALAERINFNIGEGEAKLAWFHAYQYTSSQNGAKIPSLNECVMLRDGKTWPVQDLPSDMQLVDWGDSIKLSNSDGSFSIDVPKVTPEAPATGVRGDRANPNRLYDFIYGGQAWSNDPNNSDLDYEDYVNEETYTVDLGDKGTFDIVFPPAHTSPAGIGTSSDPVVIPKDGEFTLSWPEVPQAEGKTHTPAKHFTFLAFADPPTADVPEPHASAVCVYSDDYNVVDGENVATVPQEIIDQLAPGGIIQHGRFTHYMDALDGRRFDLVAIDCNIGTYMKEM